MGNARRSGSSTRRGRAAASARSAARPPSASEDEAGEDRALPRRTRAEADAGKTDPARRSKLFVNRGERSGITEEDLRWALREGAVLPEEAIHDVHVLHRFSFVHVDPDVAERTVEYLDGTKVKGKEIRLEVAEVA